MDHKTQDNNIIITRLTALWALNESGLGGLMFALHIPLTGFFVGGFAVILISLIAFYSGNNFRRIVKATVLVLIIKATASPHAPPPAYLAVAFQGIMGALIFSALRNNKVAAIILAVLAMAESALQKVIVMTLIYGKSVWIALDKSIESIRKDFSVGDGLHYSYRIILVYVLIHVLWGILLGIFAGRLPRLIHKDTDFVLGRYRAMLPTASPEEGLPLARKKKNRYWLRFLLILLFVVSVFAFSGAYTDYKILYVILRSIAALLLIFFVLRPLLSWGIKRWLERQQGATRREAIEIMALMPGIRNYVRPSWQIAKSDHRGIGRIRYFIRSLIILTLYGQ